MENRIARIRAEEQKYHEACYDNYKLFEAGSWLHKPVKTVMDALTHFEDKGEITVLDLGCGVGRNSIPIAETLRFRKGKVVCVDLVETALTKLNDYSYQFGVNEWIETHLSDIGTYTIEAKHYDYILAVSALEHVESEQKLNQVLMNMAAGTKGEGINCIIMNTNIQETELLTGARLEPLMELNLTTEEARAQLLGAYDGWEVKYTTVKSLEFTIERMGRSILLASDCITYVVQKPL